MYGLLTCKSRGQIQLTGAAMEVIATWRLGD